MFVSYAYDGDLVALYEMPIAMRAVSAAQLDGLLKTSPQYNSSWQHTSMLVLDAECYMLASVRVAAQTHALEAIAMLPCRDAIGGVVFTGFGPCRTSALAQLESVTKPCICKRFRHTYALRVCDQIAVWPDGYTCLRSLVQFRIQKEFD